MSGCETVLPLAWMPGPIEWGIIIIVAVLLFGRKLPELGRSLGRSLVEFRKGLRDVQDEIDSAGQDDAAPRNADQKNASAQTGASPSEDGSAYKRE